jgi:hypothetical protein
MAIFTALLPRREAAHVGVSTYRFNRFRKMASPWMFILQAFWVRTMPILLSINSPFELLLRGAFGTVPYENRSSE